MKNILLESELKKMKLMMGYDTEETLTENEIPKLLAGKGYWEGELDMTNAGAFAKFKNNGVFPQAKKWVYISTYSSAVGYSDITISKPEVEVSVNTNTTEFEPASVDFNISAEDPFGYDSPELIDNAKKKLDELSKEILEIGGKYGEEFKTAYYNFLKSKTITVNAYSSIDASSNFPDGGNFAGCSKYGIGKGPRKEYNKCLSQARAQKVVDYLKGKGSYLQIEYKLVDTDGEFITRRNSDQVKKFLLAEGVEKSTLTLPKTTRWIRITSPCTNVGPIEISRLGHKFVEDYQFPSFKRGKGFADEELKSLKNAITLEIKADLYGDNSSKKQLTIRFDD